MAVKNIQQPNIKDIPKETKTTFDYTVRPVKWTPDGPAPSETSMRFDSSLQEDTRALKIPTTGGKKSILEPEVRYTVDAHKHAKDPKAFESWLDQVVNASDTEYGAIVNEGYPFRGTNSDIRLRNTAGGYKREKYEPINIYINENGTVIDVETTESPLGDGTDALKLIDNKLKNEIDGKKKSRLEQLRVQIKEGTYNNLPSSGAIAHVIKVDNEGIHPIAGVREYEPSNDEGGYTALTLSNREVEKLKRDPDSFWKTNYGKLLKNKMHLSDTGKHGDLDPDYIDRFKKKRKATDLVNAWREDGISRNTTLEEYLNSDIAATELVNALNDQLPPWNRRWETLDTWIQDMLGYEITERPAIKRAIKALYSNAPYSIEEEPEPEPEPERDHPRNRVVPPVVDPEEEQEPDTPDAPNEPEPIDVPNEEVDQALDIVEETAGESIPFSPEEYRQQVDTMMVEGGQDALDALLDSGEITPEQADVIVQAIEDSVQATAVDQKERVTQARREKAAIEKHANTATTKGEAVAIEELFKDKNVKNKAEAAYKLLKVINNGGEPTKEQIAEVSKQLQIEDSGKAYSNFFKNAQLLITQALINKKFGEYNDPNTWLTYGALLINKIGTAIANGAQIARGGSPSMKSAWEGIQEKLNESAGAAQEAAYLQTLSPSEYVRYVLAKHGRVEDIDKIATLTQTDDQLSKFFGTQDRQIAKEKLDLESGYNEAENNLYAAVESCDATIVELQKQKQALDNEQLVKQDARKAFYDVAMLFKGLATTTSGEDTGASRRDTDGTTSADGYTSTNSFHAGVAAKAGIGPVSGTVTVDGSHVGTTSTQSQQHSDSTTQRDQKYSSQLQRDIEVFNRLKLDQVDRNTAADDAWRLAQDASKAIDDMIQQLRLKRANLLQQLDRIKKDYDSFIKPAVYERTKEVKAEREARSDDV